MTAPVRHNVLLGRHAHLVPPELTRTPPALTDAYEDAAREPVRVWLICTGLAWGALLAPCVLWLGYVATKALAQAAMDALQLGGL